MRYYAETRTGTEVEISREALTDFLTTGILTRVEGGAADALDALASYLAAVNFELGADSGGYVLEGSPVFLRSYTPEILYPVRIVLLPGGEAEDGYVGADGTFIPATFGISVPNVRPERIFAVIPSEEYGYTIFGERRGDRIFVVEANGPGTETAIFEAGTYRPVDA